MTKEEIISMATKCKEVYRTKDPFEIAGELGIDINYSNLNKKAVQAYTLRPLEDRPPAIFINSNFDSRSKKVLCAHELGHAIMHNSACNHFDNGTISNEEFEANLFAVALLFNPDDFNMKLESMDNCLLKSILDHNITY